MATIYDVLSHCSDLDESLSTVTDSEKRKKVIKQHITKLSNKNKFLIPEFQREFEWLNVSEKLFLANQLKGKITVLDFFTYCCINCMHVLPDLHALEQAFSIKDGVVVLGVHSAKFENEKLTANILSAIMRYDINHPVVNDSEATLWKKLEIVCWPTFVILGPSGQYLYNLVGEGHRQQLFEFVETAVEYFKSEGELESHDLPISLEKLKQPQSNLSYPGKIVKYSDELIISDTGHHRIVITELNGVVQDVIGSGDKGFKDGSFESAMFSSPQGSCRVENCIYIADTENHAIRKVDLKSRQVSTIVGTGQMGNDKEGGAIGVNQVISSPWDLCAGKSPGSSIIDTLYIAMAGTHQIWVYFLQDVAWYKGMKYGADTCIRFAGSGIEENRNNSYPQKAGFAQPSGLSLSNDSLYIADSESSSIRVISLKDGAVKGLVGGERDPTNLFAYGDVDGKGVEAKLQHSLGLSISQSFEKLYVADSYNHKIKCVDIKSKMCTTICGSNQPKDKGSSDNANLNEPGGLAVDSNKERLYIADTNNNIIKVMDLQSLEMTVLPIIFPDVTDSTTTKASKDVSIQDLKLDDHITQQTIRCQPGTACDIKLHINLPKHLEFNTEAPQNWKLINLESIKNITVEGSSKGKLLPTSDQNITRIKLNSQSGNLEQKLYFLLQLFVCTEDSTCLVKKVLVEQPIMISNGAESVDCIQLTVQL